MGALIVPGIALIVVAVPVASAHGGSAASLGEDAIGWTLALALLLATSALLYALGVRNLWRRAGRQRGLRGAHLLRFAIGFLVLAGALLSPIDALAERSFALHMLQHELLMLVCAPLFVLARPLEAWTWAFAPHIRRLAISVARAQWLKRTWRVVTRPAGAWCLHASALWTWHAPALFDAALTHPALHVLQHACFFGSALFFWWSVFRYRAGSQGAAQIVSLFTTMLHTSALGALLTLATRPFYLVPGQPTIFALTALEDQQLGGLIMWIPGSVAYLIASLFVVASWLSPFRVRHHAA